MKIDWKRKLTSRKWWMTMITLIAGLIVALGGSGEVATTVSGCLMSLASAVAYTISEGFVDAQNAKSQNQADIMKGMTDMIMNPIKKEDDQNGEQ